MELDAFVFTGISGLKKVSALRHLRRYLLTHYMKKPSLNGLEGDEFDEKAKFFIPIVNLSGLTKGDLGAEFGSLDRIYSVKIADFREDLSTVTGEDYRQAECLFIHTHVANVIFGHYRSWLVEQGYQRVLESLNIKYIINLIDNIYTSRFYIRANGYPYTLDQVITWRDVEQMATEILAGKLFPKQSVFDKSKVLSVNHCLNTVADLMFDAEKKQIYTAYPMSKIRDLEHLSRHYPGLNVKEMILEFEAKESEAEEEDKQDYQATLLLLRTVLKEFCEGNIDVILKELHAQIREFRRFFTNSFIAYDPSTIDEKPLLIRENKAEQQTVIVRAEDFWPGICDSKERLAGRDIFEEHETIEIPVSEVNELLVTRLSDRKRPWSSIERQIRSRDLRLIDQAEGLIAYRPTLGGRWSRGVEAELNHVREIRRPFFIIKDKNDSSIDPDGTLQREGDPMIYGEWDLSTKDNRQAAFESAAEELNKQIENAQRSRIS